MQSSLDSDVLSGLDIQLPPLHSAQMEVVKNMKTPISTLQETFVSVPDIKENKKTRGLISTNIYKSLLDKYFKH